MIIDKLHRNIFCINSTKMGIVEDYILITGDAQQEYGENTVLLMQVGSFFEIYGLRDAEGNITGSKIVDVANACDLCVSAKTQTINKKQVMMAGFNITQREKYVKMIAENGYHAVIYTQDAQMKNTTRSHDETVSPGTYFNNETNILSNNIVCIWMEHCKATRYSPALVNIGVASIDNLTGHSTVTTISKEYIKSPATYDDLERAISILSPAECVVVSNMEYDETKEVLYCCGLTSVKCNILSKDTETKLGNNAKNAEKQIYQSEVLNRFFPSASADTVFETIRSNSYGAQALVMLIDFVHQHNPQLVSSLQFPEFRAPGTTLLLANHSLRQLNIIPDNRHSGKLSSVATLLDNCVTSMGSRHFHYLITAPLTDITELNSIYDITEDALSTGCWNDIRSSLKGVRDTEKSLRKIVLGKTTPKEIISLGHSLRYISNVYETITSNEKLASQMRSNNLDCGEDCTMLHTTIYETFNEATARNMDDITPEKLGLLPPDEACFINKRVSAKIDALLKKSSSANLQLEMVSEYLSSLIANKEKTKKQTNMVKIHETPKSDPILITTMRRGTILRSELAKLSITCAETSLGTGDNNIILDTSAINIGQIGGSKKDMVISSPQILEIENNIQSSRAELIDELSKFFADFICQMISNKDKLERISRFAAWADNIQNRCYCATNYNYSRPVICESDQSFIDVTGLRHPLIERLQSNEIYVENDIALGEKECGLLLYGTNAVGKTSLIRAAGIAVVMAQAGMFVAAAKMTFTPYSKLYTRIVGNDNLFKGLSTFAVEMSELRSILHGSDHNSLVLGDELCSGTESNSAISIFTAGIESLHNRGATFMFATHFHEVVSFDEIKNMKRLKIQHLEVRYDMVSGLLVYDRKLKEGPGSSMYGLEVCKALNLPDEFLSRAHDIRVKYDPKSKQILTQKKTKYNAKKLKGNCQICGGKGDEVHHLMPQSDADDNGFIGSVHKNHPANLINLCERCHDKLHENGNTKKGRIVKTSNGYKIQLGFELL
jgi:DNA mismatch repair protein MutS